MTTNVCIRRAHRHRYTKSPQLKFQANETLFRFSLDLTLDFLSSVGPSLDFLFFLFRSSSLTLSYIQISTWLHRSKQKALITYQFRFLLLRSSLCLFSLRLSNLLHLSRLDHLRLNLPFFFRIDNRQNGQHTLLHPNNQPFPTKLESEMREKQTWSSTNTFPFFLPFGVCTPTGVIIFSDGKSNSFSVYSLVLVFFCCFGALRDWDLTSFGGGRLVFDDLDDLLTLKEDVLLVPLEEALEGPLEGVGAIASGFWIVGIWVRLRREDYWIEANVAWPIEI